MRITYIVADGFIDFKRACKELGHGFHDQNVVYVSNIDKLRGCSNCEIFFTSYRTGEYITKQQIKAQREMLRSFGCVITELS